MPRYHTLFVNNPPANYEPGHFPRRFAKQGDAVEAAKAILKEGASAARVELAGGGDLYFERKQPPIPRITADEFLRRVHCSEKVTFTGLTNTETRSGKYFSLQSGLRGGTYFLGKALDEEGQPIIIEII